MRFSSAPVTGLLTKFVCLFLVGLTSCVASEADVVLTETPDVGVSVMADVELSTVADAARTDDVSAFSGVDGDSSWAAAPPEGFGSGQMAIHFSGEYHAAT